MAMSSFTELNSDVTFRATSGSSHRSGRDTSVSSSARRSRRPLQAQIALGFLESLAKRRQLAPEVALVTRPGGLRPRHGRA